MKKENKITELVNSGEKNKGKVKEINNTCINQAKRRQCKGKKSKYLVKQKVVHREKEKKNMYKDKQGKIMDDAQREETKNHSQKQMKIRYEINF